MSISEDINLITSSSQPPPNMPQHLKDAREMLHWASVVFLVMAALFVIWSLISVINGLTWIDYIGIGFLFYAAIYIIIAILAFHGATQLKKLVIPALDYGDVRRAKEESIKWMIVGIFTGLIPFIFMLLAYLKLDENPQPAPPQYQQYPQQNYQQAPPPGYAPPASQAAPPAQNPQYGPQQQNYQQAPPQYPAQGQPPQNPQAQPAEGQYQNPAPQQYPQQNSVPGTGAVPPTPPSEQYVPPQPQAPPEVHSGSPMPLQVVRCPSCGAEIPPGSETCPNCGTKL